jgi:hypothetical protein
LACSTGGGSTDRPSSLSSARAGDDLYELFGQHGAIRQIRMGNVGRPRRLAGSIWTISMLILCCRPALRQSPKTKGTAYVVRPLQPPGEDALRRADERTLTLACWASSCWQVYEEVMDCKAAMEKVNGFHLQDRYIVRESGLALSLFACPTTLCRPAADLRFLPPQCSTTSPGGRRSLIGRSRRSRSARRPSLRKRSGWAWNESRDRLFCSSLPRFRSRILVLYP